MLVINFKAYLEATGKRAVELAKSAAEVSRETGLSVIVAPQFTDIKAVTEEVDIPVFSQHIDSIKPGAFTGQISAEAVKASGADGTMLNHSERRLDDSKIREGIIFAREAELLSLVCADTPKTAGVVATYEPDMIAIEPPDLIGKGISVSKARPELLTKSLSEIRKFNANATVLCGAGITTTEDVSKALQLGTRGVLVASGIVKAKNPKLVIESMAQAMLKVPVRDVLASG